MNGCGTTKEAAAKDNEPEPSTVSENKAENMTLDQDKSFAISYSAMTRGSFKEVKVQDSKMMVQRSRSASAQDVACNKEEWGKMLSLANAVKLENLPGLEINNKAHQYDGALAATLTITKDGKTYQTPTFDHGKPPKEIEALVNYVLTLSKID